MAVFVLLAAPTKADLAYAVLSHGPRPCRVRDLLLSVQDPQPLVEKGLVADLKLVVREAGEGHGSRGQPRNIQFSTCPQSDIWSCNECYKESSLPGSQLSVTHT